MAEKIFVQGIRLFNPQSSQPDFVVGGGIIDIEALVTFINDQLEQGDNITEYQGAKQLKFQITKTKAGGLSMALDTYKPKDSKPYPQKEQPKATYKSNQYSGGTDDLPF